MITGYRNPNWGGKRPGAGRKKKSESAVSAGKEKGSWGGFRYNSGRKPSGRICHAYTISLTKYELKQIKALAKQENKSVSRFLVDRALTDRYLFW